MQLKFYKAYRHVLTGEDFLVNEVIMIAPARAKDLS